MPILRHGLIIVILLMASFVIGLQHFVHRVRVNYHASPTEIIWPAKDITGIVVATGGGRRVATGLGLLRDDHGSRLLISGTGKGVSKDDIIALIPSTTDEADQLFDLMGCCVDLGQSATNTRGNAIEARDWATNHGYHHLLLVTADFHLPRSLIHFHAAMPEIEIIPYPVPSFELDNTDSTTSSWWKTPATIAMITKEYAKYLISRVT
jgi:uncharacterized SAM-binding protein YcdF (DUF218 family)